MLLKKNSLDIFPPVADCLSFPQFILHLAVILHVSQTFSEYVFEMLTFSPI